MIVGVVYGGFNCLAVLILSIVGANYVSKAMTTLLLIPTTHMILPINDSVNYGSIQYGK